MVVHQLHRWLIFTIGFVAPLAISSLATPQATSPQSASVAPSGVSIPLEKYALPNGLEVILHEDHRTPIVAVNLWYHVGSKDEPKGKNGFAHLFEHVMFQGSKHVGEDMYFKYLEAAGASDKNGTTNVDRTNYYETLPSNELAVALWLESDRMGFLLDHANEKTFESQREVVKNERRQNYENAPYGLVSQFIYATLFPETHPYHLLTIGTPQDLDAATIGDVRGFFRTFYVPNNATLVIAGDINKDQTKRLVERYFGPIPKGTSPPVKTSPMPVVLSGEQRLSVEADVELARIQMNWVTPPYFAPSDAPLDLVGEILSTGKTSRLYKTLVYDLQIAQDVWARQQSNQLASVFEIGLTLKKGKSPDQAMKLIEAELGKLQATPPTTDEIERARTRVLTSLVFSMERMTSRANLISSYNHFTGDPGYFSKDMERYQKLSPQDVQRAATEWLPLSRRIITVVTPTKGAPRAGRLVETQKPAQTSTKKGG